jgi:hypothetical protein
MVYCTVRNTTGGYHGHQLKDLIGGITISKIFNFDYYHSVYTYLEFFGIGNNKPTTQDIPENIDFLRIGGPFWGGANFENMNKKFGWITEKYRNEDVLISIENAMRVFPHQTIKWYREELIKRNIFDEIITELTNNFNIKHREDTASFNNEVINIAIDIARGSSADKDKYPGHYTDSKNVRYIFPVKYFETIIEQIRSIKTTANKIFHIYTEKLNSDEVVETFNNYEDIVLHIGENREVGNVKLIQQIFLDFVYSDILVTCNSSFSAVASYFRKGKATIYHPHYHLYDLPEDNFFATTEDGMLKLESLKKVLSRSSN